MQKLVVVERWVGGEGTAGDDLCMSLPVNGRRKDENSWGRCGVET